MKKVTKRMINLTGNGTVLRVNTPIGVVDTPKVVKEVDGELLWGDVKLQTLGENTA